MAGAEVSSSCIVILLVCENNQHGVNASVLARLNQPHPATVIPSLHGDSEGHYQGDALVIDTVGIKLGPHRMIDRFGTPYTQALQVVDRYRLLDYEATKEALERAEKEWPRVGAIDPNYRGKGLL